MPSPDKLAIRMYETTVANLQRDVEAALNHVKYAVNSIEPDNPTIAIATARNAATTLAELTAALSALRAAEDLRFLTKEM